MKYLVFLFLLINLYANSLNDILNKIEKNDDLSKQTKQESEGMSYIITRYQLDMMQAKYLKDILKNTPISDGTNRYNLLDPFSLVFSPFGDNNIKIFIDDYEITSMYSENAIYLFSNLRLDFVDHVEIYYFSSADKYFSEPTYITIKLYSKDPKRDKGINLFLTTSEKYNAGVFSYADNDIYSSISKNKYIDSMSVDDKEVSKNSDTYNFFTKTTFNKTNLIFNAIWDKRDSFLGNSLDAKPDISNMTNDIFYIGIDRKTDNFMFNYMLSYQKSRQESSENPYLFYTPQGEVISQSLFTARNLTHLFKINSKYITKQNQLIYGALFKSSKTYDINQIINYQPQEYTGITTQNKYTLFIDEKYQYLINSIFKMAFSYSIYHNNITKYYVKNFKIGNTYLYDKNNIFKLFYYHTENIPPNYLVNRFFQTNELIPSKSENYIFSYKRKSKSLTSELYLIHNISKDTLVYSDTGFINYSEDMNINIIDLKLTKTYNYINNLTLEYFKIFFQDSLYLKNQMQLIFLSTHRYHKFDFFENLIYKKVKHISSSHEGLDLDLGVKYNVNDNLTISLKGESLLSSRYENEYIKFDTTTHQVTDPVKYPTTPKNIVLNVEYLF